MSLRRFRGAHSPKNPYLLSVARDWAMRFGAATRTPRLYSVGATSDLHQNASPDSQSCGANFHTIGPRTLDSVRTLDVGLRTLDSVR